MKKLFVTFLVLFLIISVGLFAKEMNGDRKTYKEEVNVHQLGKAPQSSNTYKSENDFILEPNQVLTRFDYDYYTGNTTGLTYHAIDITNGALTQTGAIGSTPFPMAEEYDGTSIYRVYSDLSFVEVNPDDGTTTALGSISGIAGTPTGLAYDWDSSTMYIVILDGGNAPHLGTLNLSTCVVTEIGVGTGMFIAMDFAADGYIYAPSIDDDNLYQVDPATGASTLIGPIGYNLNYGQDVTYDFVSDQLYTISCGGAYILGTYDLSTGALTEIVNMGGNQHAVFVSTITPSEPGAPAAVSDLVVTPDAGGALSCELTWINPDLTFAGDPLTELLETRVYRDGNLVYTNSSPIIGDPDGYTDIPTVSGLYNYSVVAFNSEGEGPSVNMSVWVGEDVPAAVTDLVLEDISTDTELLAHLSWINPTEGLHGGAFVNPILGYHVSRSDGVDFELTGILTEWTDDTITVIDYYSYSVVPHNSIGDGGSATSNTCLITTANVIFADDFSGGISNWVVVNNGGVGEWIIYDTPYPNSYTMPENSIPPLIAADSDEAGSGTTTDTDLILANPLDCSGMIDVILDFDSDFNMIDAADYGYVDVSSNGGDTWNNVLTYNGVDVPAAHEMINITEFAAGFEAVLIKFHSVQPGWDWWWAIDNVMISGTEGELGSIIGTVTDASTTNPIEGAIVTYSGTTQVTDFNGDYEFPTVLPGTHTLTCTADGYYEGEEEVEVLSGETVICNFAMDPNLFGILDGTVTDAVTGDPLVGAEINAISLAGYEYDAVTDDDGYYIINDIIAETYDVSCSFPNFPTGMVEDVLIEDGLTTTVDFSLEGYTFWNDFETNDGGLVSSSVWDWGAFTSGPMAGYSGTNGWATLISGNYPSGANSTLDTPMSYLISSPVAMLEFWHWYNIENSYDGGNVKISTDGGSSWSVIVPLTGYSGVANQYNPLNGEEIFCGITTDWEFLQFDLSGYVGQSVILRWHFGSDSSIQYPGWYIDDLAISGGGAPVDPGYIEGTVVIADGAGNVEDVEVEAGGVTVNPVADGTYSIEIQPGTYDVTATLDGYDTEIIEDVLVTEGNATTGVDFSLVTDGDEIIVVATKLDNNYPNPFNPETIINYSIKEAGNVTIEVYNIKGQLVKILVNDARETGNYTTVWNGRDNSNKSVASGVYFYKMKAQNYSSTKKMILMK